MSKELDFAKRFVRFVGGERGGESKEKEQEQSIAGGNELSP